MQALPALRNVDAVPIQHDGETFVCLYDTSGYVDAQILLSPPAYFVAACLDGYHGLSEIQVAFAAQFSGASVSTEKILEIVEYLDQQGFLATVRFEELRSAVDAAFHVAPTRPAHFAGRSYPEDPNALRAKIDSFFTGEGGPGPLKTPLNEAKPAPFVVVPHIDFERGGAAYAHGYAALYAEGRPDTVLLFGVAHAYAPAPFILTRKAFETPLGVLATDQAALDVLVGACEGDPFALEGLHRTEHSLEFQAVMLAYLYGPNVKIVPILCGGFGESADEAGPGVLPAVQRFLEACASLVNDPARRVTVLAGADLAHVGRRFGDPYDIDDTVRGVVATRDRQDLATVERVAPEAWYASVLQDQNARQVCGLNCIYAALKAASGRATSARLLYYGSAPDPAGGLVSFASLIGAAD